MTQTIDSSAGSTPSGRPQASDKPSTAPAIQRQVVNFSFHHLDPSFRRLSDHEKLQARSEFLSLFQIRKPGLQVLTYSTVGLKADSDFLLWRIAGSVEEFQAHTSVDQQIAARSIFNDTAFVSVDDQAEYVYR